MANYRGRCLLTYKQYKRGLFELEIFRGARAVVRCLKRVGGIAPSGGGCADMAPSLYPILHTQKIDNLLLLGSPRFISFIYPLLYIPHLFPFYILGILVYQVA